VTFNRIFSKFLGFLGTLPPDPIRGSAARDGTPSFVPPKHIPGYAPDITLSHGVVLLLLLLLLVVIVMRVEDAGLV